jgi:hypothetical protein
MGSAVDERLVGDAGPVISGHQRFLDEPEDREERIQRVIAVELGGVVDREWAPGLGGQIHDGGGTSRAFDVAMQFDFGDPVVSVVVHGLNL